MGKAILVMDMPDSCNECPYFRSTYLGHHCNGVSKSIVNCNPYIGKPKGCPLKELPSKRGVIGGLVGSNVAAYEFRARGWNECIDEILGHDKT